MGNDEAVLKAINVVASERRKVNKAIEKKAKEEAMRSLGLVKVKGALGGTYWE